MATFVRRLTEATKPEPGQRVLPHEAYSVLLDAEGTLADARARADVLLAEAEEAYARRKLEGYEDGQAEAQAMAAERALTMIDETVGYLAHAEQDGARSVLDCLRRILGEFDDDELVLRMARASIDRMRGESRVTLRVRPEVENDVRRRVGEVLAGTAEVSLIEVVGDTVAQRGCCRLESDAGVIDCSLETQLAAIERVFAAKSSPNAQNP